MGQDKTFSKMGEVEVSPDRKNDLHEAFHPTVDFMLEICYNIGKQHGGILYELF
jgi:hypothetical protein